MKRQCWASDEQIALENEELLTWGVVVGRHFGEANALAAFKRGEVEERINTSGKGPKHMYAIFNMSGML